MSSPEGNDLSLGKGGTGPVSLELNGPTRMNLEGDEVTLREGTNKPASRLRVQGPTDIKSL